MPIAQKSNLIIQRQPPPIEKNIEERPPTDFDDEQVELEVDQVDAVLEQYDYPEEEVFEQNVNVE